MPFGAGGSNRNTTRFNWIGREPKIQAALPDAEIVRRVEAWLEAFGARGVLNLDNDTADANDLPAGAYFWLDDFNWPKKPAPDANQNGWYKIAVDVPPLIDSFGRQSGGGKYAAWGTINIAPGGLVTLNVFTDAPDNASALAVVEGAMEPALSRALAGASSFSFQPKMGTQAAEQAISSMLGRLGLRSAAGWVTSSVTAPGSRVVTGTARGIDFGGNVLGFPITATATTATAGSAQRSRVDVTVYVQPPGDAQAIVRALWTEFALALRIRGSARGILTRGAGSAGDVNFSASEKAAGAAAWQAAQDKRAKAIKDAADKAAKTARDAATARLAAAVAAGAMGASAPMVGPPPSSAPPPVTPTGTGTMPDVTVPQAGASGTTVSSRIGGASAGLLARIGSAIRSIPPAAAFGAGLAVTAAIGAGTYFARRRG